MIEYDDFWRLNLNYKVYFYKIIINFLLNVGVLIDGWKFYYSFVRLLFGFGNFIGVVCFWFDSKCYFFNCYYYW